MQFQEQEKLVFEYHDGERRIFGDPMVLHRGICRLLGNPRKVTDQINAADAADADEDTVRQAMAASEMLCLAVRDVFQMQPYDRLTKTGALEAQVMGVWNYYCDWTNEVKKKVASPVTSSPPTGSTSATPTTTDIFLG